MGFCDFELATCGTTLEEAFRMAKEALTARIYLMLHDGEKLPVPSKMSSLAKPEGAVFAAMIKTDTEYLKQ